MTCTERLKVLLDKHFNIVDVDEYILMYISDLIRGQTLAEASVEDIDYFLKETFQEYSNIPSEERTSKLENIIFEVKVIDKLATGIRTTLTIASKDEREPVFASCPSVSKEPLENFVTAADVKKTSYCKRDPQVEASVRQLSELCDGRVCTGFLSHVLTSNFNGSLEEAAAWLLDTSNIVQLEQRWKRQEGQRKEQEVLAQAALAKTKRIIINKFDLEAVPDHAAKPGAGKKPPLVNLWSATASEDTKVRYLEGEVVSHKGEKFIVKQDREEWDGGSRGKVYTKGKRGKGFV